ncbi:MAG: PAS domain-containing sensor histidine kinase, partial [Candidatus Obscuribacterales bacterium]|nr:PAS domain-containing sensor histidine kinase [Candidatus Obscuribacterales bacterium]
HSFQSLSGFELLISVSLILGGGTAVVLAIKANKRVAEFERECKEISLLLKPTSSTSTSTTAVLEAVDASKEEVLATLAASVKRASLELLEAKKKERAVIEKAVDVICIIDVQSRFLSVSKACKAAWGYNPSELEGKLIADYIVSDDTEDVLNSILGASKSIDKIVFECKLKRKNGDFLNIVLTGHWSATDSGLFCIVHDITERKRAEELIKTSEQRLRLTLEGLPAGVLLLTPSRVVEFGNSEAARLFKLNASELQGRSVADLFLSTLISASARTARDVPGDASNTLETIARRKDGSEFPVEVTVNTIQLSGEDKQIAVFVDKTSQHELEQLKSEFIAMVIHDLRTPLSAMGGMLVLLEQGALGEISEKGRKISTNVQRDIKRLLRLISDLLDLEKIKSGMFELECAEFKMRNAVEAASDVVLNLANDKNLKIETSLNDSTCFGDEERLVQVLVNLLSNSIKYAPEGSQVTVAMQDQDGFVKVLVSDMGRGIPADKIGKIFEKFEQVEVLDAKKKGGTGLGLAICKAIVGEHGGEIGVESEFGKGSTFWFTVPKQAK